MIVGLSAAHGRAGRGFPALGLELVKHAGELGLGTILGARLAGSKTSEDGAIVVIVEPEFLATDLDLGDHPATALIDNAEASGLGDEGEGEVCHVNGPPPWLYQPRVQQFRVNASRSAVGAPRRALQRPARWFR